MSYSVYSCLICLIHTKLLLSRVQSRETNALPNISNKPNLWFPLLHLKQSIRKHCVFQSDDVNKIQLFFDYEIWIGFSCQKKNEAKRLKLYILDIIVIFKSIMCGGNRIRRITENSFYKLDAICYRKKGYETIKFIIFINWIEYIIIFWEKESSFWVYYSWKVVIFLLKYIKKYIKI